MSRKRKKNHINEPFIPILKHMIKSPAFKALSNPARVAYLLLKAQINSHDQQEIIFPYSHAMEYMEKRTFSAALKQLIKMGFIEKTQFGGLYRRTNVYKLSDQWRTYQNHTTWHNLKGDVKMPPSNVLKIA